MLYLVNENNMGEFNSSTDQVVQEFQAIYGQGTSHIHGAPTYFNSDLNGPTAYVWGENDYLRAYPFNPTTGLMNTTALVTSTVTAPATRNNSAMPGGFTAISANGNTNGIVWASTPYNGDATRNPVQGVLYAFNADTLALLWTDKTLDSRDEVGRFAKYCPPVVANGRMFIPNFGPVPNTTGSGQLLAYGLLPVLTVVPANAQMTQGSALPTLSGTVTGLLPADTLGGTIVVTYSTPANSASTPGTYPITATVSGSSAAHYNLSVVTGTLTVLPPVVVGGAGTISYPAGFTGSTLQLNGSASIVGSRLRLTDGKTYESASSFYPTPVNVQSFVNDFTFQLTNPSADGFTMLIQNDGLSAMGAFGGGLGFGSGNRPGIVKGVAVKFDLFSNGGEGTNSTGIYIGGQSPQTPAITLNATGISLHAATTFWVHAVYNGAVLNVTITDQTSGATSTQSYPIDIPGTLGSQTAYVGFSAGTGGLTSTDDILNWSFSPIPAFAAGFSSAQQLTLNGGPALNGAKLRLLDQHTSEARSAFFTYPVNVQSFNTAFTFQLTNPSADGIAFVLQGTGPSALGGYGGSLGVGPKSGTTGGIAHSVAVKLDLYNNSGEGTNSTGMYLNGVAPTVPAVNLTPTGINLHSGDPILAQLTYNGVNLVAVLTDTVTLATATQTYPVNIPSVLGSSIGYVGFTGGTGALMTTADILNWSYTPGPIVKPRLVYPTVRLSAVSSGAAFGAYSWGGFTDTTGTLLSATAAGNQVSLTVNVPAAGSYDVSLNTEQTTNRGMFQLQIDGLNVGPQVDEYSASANGSLQSVDLGVVALNAGQHTFTFTVAGQNANSTGFAISLGQLILTTQ